MESTAEVLRYANAGAFILLGVVTFVQWQRGRHPASLWVFLAFAVLAVFYSIRLIQPDDFGDSRVEDLFVRFQIAVLLLFPYFLYRVSTSFKKPRRFTEVVAALATAVVIGWSFAISMIPGEGDPRPASFRYFVFGVLAQWTYLSAVVAVRFWRAGRDQTSVARRRMRMLSIASISLSIVLIVAGTTEGSELVEIDIVRRVITLFSAVAFFLAFTPPRFLRTIWRRPIEESLRQGTVDLMAATTEEEVTNFLLPCALTIVGGEAIAVVDNDGNVIGAQGFEGSALEEARLLLNAATAEEHERLSPDLISLRFAFGWLLLRTGPYSTYFGREEVELLGALGALANLAIERIRAADLRLALAQAHLRRQQALEINDNIVQGLAVAKYALDLGEVDRARPAIEETLAAARKIISDLVEEVGEEMELGPGTLTRDIAAGGFRTGKSTDREAG